MHHLVPYPADVEELRDRRYQVHRKLVSVGVLAGDLRGTKPEDSITI